MRPAWPIKPDLHHERRSHTLWLRVSYRTRGRGLTFDGIGRALDGCTETQETTAERDRAHREPRPPECESGDCVGQPVDTEHHPARGDRNGEPDGDRDDERPCAGVRRRTMMSATAAHSAAAVAE